MHHTGSTRINSYDPSTMFTDWYFERNTLPRIVIDDCPGNLPCNPSCARCVKTCSTRLQT